jgi:hypothetical protein
MYIQRQRFKFLQLRFFTKKFFYFEKRCSLGTTTPALYVVG